MANRLWIILAQSCFGHGVIINLRPTIGQEKFLSKHGYACKNL